MTILIQQSTSAQNVVQLVPTQAQQQTSSIVCTAPVVPNVIYHHHLHHHIAPPNVPQIIHQQSITNSKPCYVSYSYLPTNLTLNPSVTFNEQYGSSMLWNTNSIQSPSMSVNSHIPYNNHWQYESTKVKENYILDKSISGESKSSACSSSATSSTASTSSYYASISSNSSNASTSCSPPTVSTPNSSSTVSSTCSSSKIQPNDNGTTTITTSINDTIAPIPPPMLPQTFGPLNPTPANVAFPFYNIPSVLSQLQSTLYKTANQANSIISLREFYSRLGVHYTPVPWNQSYGMERVWMSEFRRIFFSFYNELWSIQPVEKKPSGIKLHMFVDSAKVRFCCDKCGHSWTSMKGRVVFWFNLLPPNFDVGIVTIKLFGQKCESCKLDLYEQPMWYPEEVTKVLMNLFNRVGQIFYGFEKTKFEKQRRLGKPRTPHNKYLCQACLEGICLSRKRSCQQITPDDELNDEDSASEQSSSDVPNNVKNSNEDESHYSEDSGIVESETRSESESVRDEDQHAGGEKPSNNSVDSDDGTVDVAL